MGWVGLVCVCMYVSDVRWRYVVGGFGVYVCVLVGRGRVRANASFHPHPTWAGFHSLVADTHICTPLPQQQKTNRCRPSVAWGGATCARGSGWRPSKIKPSRYIVYVVSTTRTALKKHTHTHTDPPPPPIFKQNTPTPTTAQDDDGNDDNNNDDGGGGNQEEELVLNRLITACAPDPGALLTLAAAHADDLSPVNAATLLNRSVVVLLGCVGMCVFWILYIRKKGHAGWAKHPSNDVCVPVSHPLMHNTITKSGSRASVCRPRKCGGPC